MSNLIIRRFTLCYYCFSVILSFTFIFFPEIYTKHRIGQSSILNTDLHMFSFYLSENQTKILFFLLHHCWILSHKKCLFSCAKYIFTNVAPFLNWSAFLIIYFTFQFFSVFSVFRIWMGENLEMTFDAFGLWNKQSRSVWQKHTMKRDFLGRKVVVNNYFVFINLHL